MGTPLRGTARLLQQARALRRAGKARGYAFSVEQHRNIVDRGVRFNMLSFDGAVSIDRRLTVEQKAQALAVGIVDQGERAVACGALAGGWINDRNRLVQFVLSTLIEIGAVRPSKGFFAKATHRAELPTPRRLPRPTPVEAPPVVGRIYRGGRCRYVFSGGGRFER